MHAHTCAHTRKVRMRNTCTHTHTLVRTHMHTHPAAICTAWLLARWPCRQRLLLREAVLSALPDAGRHDPAAPTRSGLFGGGWKRAVSGGAWGARSPAEGVDTRWWPGALRRGELTPHLTAVLLLDPGKPPTSRPASACPSPFHISGHRPPQSGRNPVPRLGMVAEVGRAEADSRSTADAFAAGVPRQPGHSAGWRGLRAGAARAPAPSSEPLEPCKARAFCFTFRAVGGRLET